MSDIAGGFSNYYTPPSYQQKAVSEYLANHNTLPYYIANAHASNIGENGGVYNRAGRGYPDVSANGAYLLVYNNLTQETFFGTSKSDLRSRTSINILRIAKLWPP
jgi:tripeptidyl-peptidase-1